MSEATQLVVFSLDEEHYGLPLKSVERIVRAAEVTRLPKAPAVVLGAINVGGALMPVLNVRQRFGLREVEVRPADQFLIARTKGRSVILVIDEAKSVIEVPTSEVLNAREIVPDPGQISGVVILTDGLVLIYDVDAFLSLDEERALDEAITDEIRNET